MALVFGILAFGISFLSPLISIILAILGYSRARIGMQSALKGRAKAGRNFWLVAIVLSIILWMLRRNCLKFSVSIMRQVLRLLRNLRQCGIWFSPVRTKERKWIVEMVLMTFWTSLIIVISRRRRRTVGYICEVKRRAYAAAVITHISVFVKQAQKLLSGRLALVYIYFLGIHEISAAYGEHFDAPNSRADFFALPRFLVVNVICKLLFSPAVGRCRNDNRVIALKGKVKGIAWFFVIVPCGRKLFAVKRNRRLYFFA